MKCFDLKKLLLAFLTFPTALIASTNDYAPPVSVVSEIWDIKVKKNGASELDYERLIRIDQPSAAQNYGQASVGYDSRRDELTILEAYTIKPDGTKITVIGDRVKTQQEAVDGNNPYFSDRMQKVVIYPQVEVGSQVYLRWKRVRKTPVFHDQFAWYLTYSPQGVYEKSHVTLRVDESMPMKVYSEGINGGQMDSIQGWKVYQYEYKQLKATPPEPNQLEDIDFTPRVEFSTFKDYKQLAQAHNELYVGKADVTPQIVQLANKIVDGARDPSEKARRIYNWVSSNIRYVGVDVGSGGFEPNAADDVLSHRYGDCKDHVVLLESLLSAVGIESQVALINTAESFTLPKLPLIGYFNHVITYIPSLNLFLDSTAEFAPFGVLPDSEIDKPVVLLQTGELLHTPKETPQTNSITINRKLYVLQDGRVKGTSESVYSGSTQVDSRTYYHQASESDNHSLVSSRLGRFGESGIGSHQTPDPSDLDVPWVVKSSFVLDPVVNVPGLSAMTIPTGLTHGGLRMLAVKTVPHKRLYPHACGSVRITENTTVAYPKNIQIESIPTRTNVKSGQLTYRATYKLENRLLTVKREYQSDRKSSVCNAGDDRAWLAVQPAIQRDIRSQVFIR